VVSGDKAGILKVWDLETGKGVHEIVAHNSEQITSIAVKMDGTLLTTHVEALVIKFWFK